MNFSTPSPALERYHFQEWIWFANISVNTTLMLIAVYTTVSLIYHEMRVAKKRNTFLKPLIEAKILFKNKLICIAIGFCCFFHHSVVVGNLWISKKHMPLNITFEQQQTLSEVCQFVSKSGNFFLGLNLVFVYLFLWFRQRIFYVHEAFQKLNNKITKTISNFFPFALCFGFVTLIVSYFAVVHYKFHADIGCLFNQDVYFQYGSMMVALGISCVFAQVTLVLLFIYPIIKLRSDNDSCNSKWLIKRYKKALFLTIVCIVSDATSAIVLGKMYVRNTNSSLIFYNLNSSVNHFVTIACFDEWKELLCPWCIKKKYITDAKLEKNNKNVLLNQM